MTDRSDKPVIVAEVADAASNVRIGAQVGRYRLLEKLGEGGAGVVFRAEDTTTTESVALKLLRDGELANEEHRRRFLREARLAAALEHEGIIRVREVDEADGHVFLAMEIAPGTSLRRRLDAARASGTHVPLGEALAVAEAIANAVAHGTRKGSFIATSSPTT